MSIQISSLTQFKPILRLEERQGRQKKDFSLLIFLNDPKKNPTAQNQLPIFHLYHFIKKKKKVIKE